MTPILLTCYPTGITTIIVLEHIICVVRVGDRTEITLQGTDVGVYVEEMPSVIFEKWSLLGKSAELVSLLGKS